jgi:hypothetical protein
VKRAGRLYLGLLLGTSMGFFLWALAWQWARFAFLDYALVAYRVDGLSLLFGYLFSIAAFLSLLFS